jgi:hypothetical protein
VLLAALTALAPALSSAAPQGKKDAVTDPALADADFAIQGEYAGEIQIDGKNEKYGVQVIALGGGSFRAVGYPGGLPGDGWNRKDKASADGATEDGVTHFPKFLGGATVRQAILTVEAEGGGTIGTLRRVERRSPTLGAKPPQGAKVLFDGQVNDFQPGKTTEDGLLTVPQRSKHLFAKDYTLHLEFRTPYKPYARGQGRGNSGAYLQGRNEIQVLDSFGLEGKRNECGGLYGRKDCDLNMCFPPLTWQTYDVEFRAPRTDGDGKLTAEATVSVKHNGVLIHAKVPLGKTPEKGGPLTLQNHGNPVHYRNIWVVEKTAASD